MGGGFQSTRPVRGATHGYTRSCTGVPVSIHAPRAGRDCFASHKEAGETPVSIHAPRAGRDRTARNCIQPCTMFQSTRPVRGATLTTFGLTNTENVSIHAPRKGGDRNRYRYKANPAVAIHAPRKGATRVRHVSISRALLQSTHPSRGATRMARASYFRGVVSIHAPLAGCDLNVPYCTSQQKLDTKT